VSCQNDTQGVGFGDANNDSGIACPRSKFEPKLVANGDFKYQKMFGDEGYFATGMVVIPVNSQKPGKPSKDNCYVSWVSLPSRTAAAGEVYSLQWERDIHNSYPSCDTF
jgi:hypothetical protein